MALSARLRIAAFFIVCALPLHASSAFADCTSPAGEESRMTWDFTNHVMKICDGTNWLTMGGGSSSGSAGYIQFSNGSGGFSSDTGLIWDNTNKRLGINVSAPSSDLSFGGGANRMIGMTSRSGVGDGFSLTMRSGATASGVTDKNGGSLILSSGVGTGTGSSAIYFRTATPQASTNTTDNTPTDKMVILGNGNVGIGTTTPSNPLHVVGSMRVERSGTPNQYLEVTLGGASGNQLNFNNVEASKKNFVLSSLHGGTGSAAGALDFVFSIGSSSSPTEAMRIKENGNVGIGATSPASLLHLSQANGSGDVGLTIQNNATTLGETSSLYFLNSTTAGAFAGQISAIRMNGSADSDLVFSTRGSATLGERVRITAGGNVGIGTTSPTEKLHVNGNVLATTYLYSSDRRLKAGITPLAGQLAKVAALEPVAYTMKADSDHAKRLGLIAQDVEAIYPEVVHTAADGMKSLDYQALIAPLIGAVKELKAANDNLRQTLETQGQIIEAQGREIDALKAERP